jgi:hypothetical protein
MPVKKGYVRKYPNIGTVARIRALAEYREQHIKETGKPPIWTAACYKMGINRRRVLRHAPDLARNWYDTNVRC